MLKRSFVNRQQTAVSLLYRPQSAALAVAGARTAESNGADGIAIEISHLPLEERSCDIFRGIINCVHLPFMFINYRKDKFLGADDEARQVNLLNAAEAGADVIDVMGDLYAPAPRELTFDTQAIARQKKLIDEIHARGAYALMSSHATGEFVPPEDVLEMMKFQSSRGADLLKVVTKVDTEDEFLESVRTLMLLHKEIEKPFIYLAGGKFGRMIRYMGPKFGVAVEFAVNDYEADGVYNQPTIHSFRQVLDHLNWEL